MVFAIVLASPRRVLALARQFTEEVLSCSIRFLEHWRRELVRDTSFNQPGRNQQHHSRRCSLPCQLWHLSKCTGSQYAWIHLHLQADLHWLHKCHYRSLQQQPHPQLHITGYPPCRADKPEAWCPVFLHGANAEHASLSTSVLMFINEAGIM